MKLIVVSDNLGAAHNYNIGQKSIYVLIVLLLAVFVSIFTVGFHLGTGDDYQPGAAETSIDVLAVKWRQQLQQQTYQIDSAAKQSELEVKALSVHLAQLQARLLRMEALGERVTEVAKLDKGEFDFSRPPAVGGPEVETDSGTLSHVQVQSSLAQLQTQLENRSQQLAILEQFLVNRKMAKEVSVTGRPIKKGWLSSHYGKRVDPFKGHVAWHKGVDFAGKEDDDIIAVASGIVTWSGKRSGYGNLVEVNHGNGYVTRYAHNKSNLVGIGDVIKKGTTLAKMGSTGRSTGPHVHFEVYKNGRPVDPERYIYRR